MKILITLVLTALPAAAHAYAGYGPGGPGDCGHGGCSGFAPFLICALIAALGYWVAQHAAKETANCIKRMGSVTGTILVVIGLLGILCAAGSHIKRNMACHGSCPVEQSVSDADKGEMAVKVSVMKTAETAQKKTK